MDRPLPRPAPGAAGWYQAVGKEKQGPFALEQLRQRVAAGQLTPADMLCPHDAAHWVPAASVPGLFPAPLPAGPSAEAPTLVSVPRAAARSTPAVSLPGYEILGELGRGGMGVVYQARQVKLNRLVALKMVLSGVHAGENELARFRREAEALARLQHPHIVQVYEVGEHEGRPFFSLEFVDGGSLDKKLQGKPLPPKEAAALLEVLARAVAAAHQKGVWHRDLKPANVLLTADGTPKLTDFGLAKQIDGASGRATPGGQTASGAVLGTPSYMPPEQALSELKKVGPGSDVYSLGAVLYELLTGRPPFVGAEVLDTLFQVATQEPVPPARLNARTPRDLETICLKCLEKDPKKRYASAEDLAEDLRRFQAGEPIQARPVGRLGLWVKWVKRRPAVAALWGVVLTALLAGGGVWYRQAQAQVERRAEAAAALAQARVEVQRLRPGPDDLPEDPALWSAAWAAARRAEALVEGGGGEENRQRLRALLGELGGLERDRRMAARLEEASYLESDSDKEGRVDYAAAERGYAAAFRDYGVDPDTQEPAAAAARLRACPIRKRLALGLDNWARLRKLVRKVNPAGWRRLLKVARLVDPDPTRNRLRDALARGDSRALKALAGTVRGDRLPAVTVILLAEALAVEGDWAAAVRLLRLAQRRHPDDFWVNRWLAAYLLKLKSAPRGEELRYLTAALALRPNSYGVHNDLGIALQKRRDWDGALAAYRKALALKPNVAVLHHNLGAALLESKRDLAGAIACFHKALRLRPDFAGAYYNLGLARYQQRDLAGAIACYRRAIRLQPDFVDAYNNLGSDLREQGDVDGAIAACKEALRLRPDDALAHYNLGNALRDRKDVAEAIAEYRKALVLQPHYPEALTNLGNVLVEQGRPAEALACYQEAIRFNKDFPDAHTSLGSYLDGKGRLNEAIAEFQEAIRLKPDAVAYHNLGNTLYHKGDQAGARAAYQEAIRLNKNLPEPYAGLGLALLDAGQLAEAIRLFRKAIRLRPGYLAAHANLGLALQKKGDLAGAMTEYRKVLALQPDHAGTHSNVGNVLRAQGDVTGALAAYRKALTFEPNLAQAQNGLALTLYKHRDLATAVAEFRVIFLQKPDLTEAAVALGNVLASNGNLAGASAAYRYALRLKPDFAKAHINLGSTLSAQGDLAGAIAEFRAAIRLKQYLAEANFNLALALQTQGDMAGAIAAYRAALRVRPDHADAHYHLALALNTQGDVAGAIAAYRAALRARPDYAEAHCNLGLLFLSQGQFAEGLAELKRGHQLGSRNPRWRHPSAAWVRRAERLVALDARLLAILQGQAQPASAAEAIEYAQLCQSKKLHAAAAGLFNAAFKADAKLADDLQSSNRYNAACVAALAAAGQGNEGKLADQERTRWRQQALLWLRADLTRWARQLDQGTAQAAALVKRTLQHWQRDPDLAGVREAAALAKLPAAEQQAWRQLWADVDRLFQQAKVKK